MQSAETLCGRTKRTVTEVYEELVKALRYAYKTATESLSNPYRFCAYYAAAADAIEELQKQVEDYECRLEISPEAEYAIDKHCNDIISRMDKLIKGLDDKPRWIPVGRGNPRPAAW